jgi:hypothetical protein
MMGEVFKLIVMTPGWWIAELVAGAILSVATIGSLLAPVATWYFLVMEFERVTRARSWKSLLGKALGVVVSAWVFLTLAVATLDLPKAMIHVQHQMHEED